MKALLFAAGSAAALALAPAPIAAQDAAPMTIGFVGNEVVDTQEDMFEVEPLTAEQEARLPTAQRLVDLVIPPDAFQDTIGGMFGDIFGVEPEAQTPNAVYALYEALGYAYYEDIDPTKAERALEIIDPHWRERSEIEASAMQDYVRQFMAAVEPVVRQSMVELYAIHFTEAQLLDIEAFFQTETGQVFARQSMNISRDQRLYSAMFRSFESLEEPFETDLSALEEALAAVPPRANYGDLTERERALLAALLGVDEAGLEQIMASAALDAMSVESVAVDAEEAAEAIEAEMATD